MIYMSRDVRKQVFMDSDQVQQKLGWAITEDSLGLEILDLERRGVVIHVAKLLVRQMPHLPHLCLRPCACVQLK